MNTADILTAAGWKSTGNGQWLSPLTGHVFTERHALAIAAIKPRTRNPIYRPRKFVRQ